MDLNKEVTKWEGLVHKILQTEYQWAWSRKQNMRKFRRPIDYEDLAQEGLCAILDAIENYDSDRGATFKVYAWTVVKRRVSRYIRRNVSPIDATTVWGNLSDDDDKKAAIACRLFSELSKDATGDGLEWEPYIADQDEGIEQLEAKEYLEKCLECLEGHITDRQLQALTLRFADDLTYEQVAKELDMSVSATHKLIKRTLDNARDRLERNGYAP
jgi:RNA polymerase sigma factor (sigma-70 family)